MFEDHQEAWLHYEVTVERIFEYRKLKQNMDGENIITFLGF